jgi:DNA helicase II / ATP-dependent DNA helicase PcrA
MRFIADLHIHSRFSRATSRDLNLEQLDKWAQIKGLTVVATGDITHPKWLEELKTRLQPAKNGLYQLNQEFKKNTESQVPGSCKSQVFFVLSGEISTIYKKNDHVRKIHHVIFLPSIEAAEKLQATLGRIGNIHSDGRPILGLDSRDLLEILLNTDEKAHLVPAHIWTPWFSLLGSKSGFNSIQECFADLTPHIFAVETGLSSDPPMNWRLSQLDDYVLISNSDAHSPAKLAREANIFDADISYESIFSSLKKKSNAFQGTIEFFPEEGKYHMDGHRKCARMMRPEETLQHHGLCPVCNQPATLGVAYRVQELSDRHEGTKSKHAKPYINLIPLTEILGEVKGTGPNSKAVTTLYSSMLNQLGPELKILMDYSLMDIEKATGSLTAEAIRRMRCSEVKPIPGYDGEYGIIRIFDNAERLRFLNQETFFSQAEAMAMEKKIQTDAPMPALKVAETAVAYKIEPVSEERDAEPLNEEQKVAVKHRGTPLIIKAGPGTGKTRTLTFRLASLIQSGEVAPENILAITFTNKATQEMKNRLNDLLDPDICNRVTIQTFHAFGTAVLRGKKLFSGRTNNFTILDPGNDPAFKKAFYESCNEQLSQSILDKISALKGQLVYSAHDIPKEIYDNLSQIFLRAFEAYQTILGTMNAVDYDDLISLPIQILSKEAETRRKILQKFQVIAFDEFQDINPAQYQLFRILAIAAKDVCVIGDPDQAIYGFRGASREFFYKFCEDFPNAKTLELQRSYRSAQKILAASVQMLENGQKSGETHVWSKILPEMKTILYQAPSDRAEAEYVVQQIEQLIGGTSHYSLDTRRVYDHNQPTSIGFADIAILFRIKRLAAPLLEALSRSGMPHETIEDIPIHSTAKIHFLINALKIASQRINNLESRPSVVDSIKNLWPDLAAVEPQEKKESKKIYQMLLDMAQPYGDRLIEFTDALMLCKDYDLFDVKADRIHLLTLHASKGLEFPVVFIIGCEEEIIPYFMQGKKTDIDEERRLLYVGMTRAQKLLFLTHSKSRNLYGMKRTQLPSRFIAAISNTLLQRQTLQIQRKKSGGDQLCLF